MKKSVILAVLGMAAGVVASYGQGHIQFNTYTANGSTSILALLGNGLNAGQTVPSTFTGELLFSTTAINDSASTSQAALSPGWTIGPIGTFAATGIPGTFAGPNLDLASYVSGPVWFEIAVFSGSSYAASLGAGSFAGHTASFSQGMATGQTLPWVADGNPSALSGSGSGFLPGSFNVFTTVPEPTTLALAGLGGLASLVAFRRKQA